MKKIYAPHDLATSLMDDLFSLYQYVAIGLDIDIENKEQIEAANAEGIAYAQRKFVELADEFEKSLPGIEIRWCHDSNEDE